MGDFKKGFGVGCVVSAIIGAVIFNVYSYNLKQTLCEYSKYATPDHSAINSKLYCRSSDNSYQRLTKPKPRSIHLDEHKKEQK